MGGPGSGRKKGSGGHRARGPVNKSKGMRNLAKTRNPIRAFKRRMALKNKNK